MSDCISISFFLYFNAVFTVAFTVFITFYYIVYILMLVYAFEEWINKNKDSP